MTGLLRRAADQAGADRRLRAGGRLLAAALRLTDPDETDALIELHTRRHAALYSLGRLDEADEVYRTVDQLCPARWNAWTRRWCR